MLESSKHCIDHDKEAEVSTDNNKSESTGNVKERHETFFPSILNIVNRINSSPKGVRLTKKMKWKYFINSDTPKFCSICLEAYKSGDEVCLSHNDDCDHVFHKDCIVSWLIQHDDCPNCRAVFVISMS